MIERLASFRFFCSHNTFEVFDQSVEPWNEPSELDGLTDEERTRRLIRGWYRRGRSICIRTMVQSYDNRIDVFRATSPPSPANADRVLALNLSLPSGVLTIFGLDYGERVNVGPGQHALYCRAFNLGVDPPPEAPPLEDDEFLRRDDLERFELVLVPGSVEQEGVIYGPQTLVP